MFFRRKRSPTRAGDWREFARRLELVAAPECRDEFCDLLDLAPDTVFPALFARDLGEGERLFFFDYQDPRPVPDKSPPFLASGCVLRSRRPLAVSLRASARLHPVLESLAASATGGRRLSLPGSPDLDEKLSVYARDAETALRLLTPAACQTLVRALTEREAAPTLLVGGRHLVLLCKGAARATRLEALEELSADLLSLYAAFSATAAAGEG